MPKLVKDEDIFQAVIQVILERGYSSATTKQIADAANVSEVTIFRKYKNKAQLVKQAILAITDQMDFETATEYTGDIVADLTRIVEHYLRLANRHGSFMAILLTEIPRYPEFAELIDRPFSIMHDIEQLIAHYQAEGVLRRETPLHTVAALLGPLIFNVMMRGALPDIHLPPPDLTEHIAYFLAGRSSRPADA
jgi:AcrR family transcriptional regulator